jgi:transposase
MSNGHCSRRCWRSSPVADPPSTRAGESSKRSCTWPAPDVRGGRCPTTFRRGTPCNWYFKQWNEQGITDRIHDALRAAVRDGAGRDPMASAGIVDAQSVKGADTVGRDSRGYDAGKKVNGRKRHVVFDTIGLRYADVGINFDQPERTTGAISASAPDSV